MMVFKVGVRAVWSVGRYSTGHNPTQCTSARMEHLMLQASKRPSRNTEQMFP